MPKLINHYKRKSHGEVALVCQLLSALSSASCENFAAVGCCHSLSEAVLLFSVELLRLICPFHLRNLLESVCWRLCGPKYKVLTSSHNLSSINYNSKPVPMSIKSFLNKQKTFISWCIWVPRSQSPPSDLSQDSQAACPASQIPQTALNYRAI